MSERHRKGLWEKTKPNTLVKKCIYGICAVTLLMLLVAGNLMADGIYQFLKPKMQQDFTVLTSAVSTKISYLLHQNTQYLLSFWKDADLFDDVLAYAEREEESEELKSSIADRLVGEYRGADEPGAIISTRKLVLIVDWDQMICQPEMEAYGEKIMESVWFSGLKERLEEMPVYAHDALKRQYSPVFEETPETEEFISLVMLKEWEGHQSILVMVEPFKEFRSVFSDFLNADVEDFCLIGGEGEILFQNMEDSAFRNMTSEEIESLFVEEQYETNLVERGADTVIGVRTSYQIERLKLVTCLSKEDFLRPYRSFIQMINVMLIGFTLILLSLVMIILSHSLYKLKKLASQMRDVQGEMYQVPKSIKSKDEIGMLADTFYQMMDQIQENMEKIKEQEQREKRIEYSLLVSQIDPHFIYNTLNTITYLAELNQTEDIMIINKALIGMLRDRLKMTKLQIYDTLEKEKQQLASYMTIQQYLSSNEITWEFPIPEECAKVQYPKNVLQPLVENAVLHGILLHRDAHGELVPGEICISVSLSGEKIITEMKDNGIGMSQSEIQRYFCDLPDEKEEMMGRDTKEHIGIYNIRMRMEYLYGEQFHISARTRTEGGLQITLEFPVCQKEQRDI